MEERPTRRVYIEILTCTAIIQHLEESRSHENKQEADRARGQGTRPPPLGARPPLVANQGESRGYAPPPLRIKENRSIKVGLIRRPRFI